MAASQQLIWTLLPNGVNSGGAPGPAAGGPPVQLQFSVLISPRLLGAPTLASFPDWAASGGAGQTWPQTLAPVQFGVQFLDVPGAPVLPAVQLTQTSTPATVAVPSAGVFAARFPASTPVVPWTYPDYDTLTLRSYPMASVSDFLSYWYGRYGVAYPSEFPTCTDLSAQDAWGAIGFEDDNVGAGAGPEDGNFGPLRKADLLAALETALASGPVPNYPFVEPSDPGYVMNTQYAFLQAETFLRRFLPGVFPEGSPAPSSPAPPAQDFAQLVGFAGSMPTLLRLLGLVVDCTVDPSALPGFASGLTTRVALVVTGFQPLLAATESLYPSTQCTLSPTGFQAVPLSPSDYADGMVTLGDPSLYRVIEVDPDGSAIKAMQLADTVTRSQRNGSPLTDSTPTNFSLPALRTGGFAFARTGRAVQMEAALARQRSVLEAGADFSTGAGPTLYADDLVRGVRVDVLDVADGVWRSLMWREADSYNPGDGSSITLLEEDSVVPAPTTASQSANPNDLYLQDSLTSWGGWSLAVPRYGTPLQDPAVPQGSAPPSVAWTIPSWEVPGDSAETVANNPTKLPRLRFGRAYQFRARTADHAGNGLSVAAAATTATFVTSPAQYLRFEPVEAPRVLLTAPHTPGESAEVIVIRSESLTEDGTGALDNGTVLRLLVPSRSSQTRAEQHGAYDLLLTTGQPLDATMATWTDIANRDQAPIAGPGVVLSSPPGPTAPTRQVGEVYYATDALPIAYLPDFLAGTAIVTGLPANSPGGLTSAVLPFDTAGNGWPDYQACRVTLSRAPETASDPGGVPANWSLTTYTPVGGTVTTELDVTLPKGQTVTTQVNALLSAPQLELMALKAWIEQWAAEHGADPGPALEAMANGLHWMITPWRTVTFVHAVRTPLAPPSLAELQPIRTDIGQTDVTFPESFVEFDRPSTGRVDLVAQWAMPVDTGSNPDPVTPQNFQATAFSMDIDRTGPDSQEVTEVEEFGDTKFRSVDYQAVATTSYLEYFREQAPVSLAADGAVTVPDFVFNASTVELFTLGTSTTSPMKLVAAPPGTPVDADPAPGDYVVVAPDPLHPVLGQGIALLVNGGAAEALGGGSGTFTMSHVGPTTYAFSTVRNFNVPSTARPAAPSVLYIVPIYQRAATSSGVTRTGGALRVYLDRPWWSSGDGELLGVVCCPPATLEADGDVPTALAPFVTQWGFDPVFSSTTSMPAQPNPGNFPLRLTGTFDSTPLPVEGTPYEVNVAGHEVGFDSTRGLWFCDVQLLNDGVELPSYMPFVRLALARFQPNSLEDAYLSKIVLTDWAQLAPDRSVTVTQTGVQGRRVLFSVTVAGRAATATAASAGPSLMTVTVEQMDTRITDDALAWGPVPYLPVFDLAPTVHSGDDVTWSGTVFLLIDEDAAPKRFTFQEYERIGTGSGGQRLVFTETFVLPS